MLFSLYQYVKQTTILILLILGGAYWEGTYIREGYLFWKSYFLEGHLLENVHSLDHLWQCRTIKVFITSFKSPTRPKPILFNM